ncbi:ras-related protein Rap-2a-like [Saccostrea echinata]|uniref:ras-related protein Rap-2a-like n=1 Tax=Saccostrea echinata TaxID=191078 RepID=UPI002A8342D5|nr:ras-related protein Rap-2a-like [Saccostrea echinata]
MPAKMEKCFRIAVLGAKMVGKTCLIKQILKRGFREKDAPTIETMFRYDIHTSENKYTKLEILDTAGDFEYLDLLKEAVKTSHAFALVFDLNNAMQTFREIEALRQLIIEEKREQVPIIVVGNKSDLIHEDTIDNKVIDAIVSIDWGCTYLTASAQCDVNVSDVYRAVCKELNIIIEQKPDVNDVCKETKSQNVKPWRRISLHKRRFSVKSL